MILDQAAASNVVPKMCVIGLAIDRKNYPQLDSILWDTRQELFTHKEALDLYERRWGYVDQLSIQAHEKELIEHLTNTVGNGVFLCGT